VLSAIAVMFHNMTASTAPQRNRSRIDRPFTSTSFVYRHTNHGNVIAEQ